MKICIHRGQNQIGGSIIEISTRNTRIFLDVGIELDESENIAVPEIEGVFKGNKGCDAILISHYHPDHMGLLEFVLPEIPIYMGKKAYEIYEASADYRGRKLKLCPNYVYDNKKMKIGDFQITSFLCDHSSYDSYMYLIELEGKKILYTGDFRANGRLSYIELLSKLPEVDVLICEGTTLTREEVKNIEEEKLEQIAVEYLKKYSGPAFIMMSAMNVERMITAYNIARKTGRLFLEDIYTADVARASGIEILEPNIEDGVRVFMTGGDKQYERLVEYGKAKIGKKQIANEFFLMCIRQSMKNYLEKLNELVSFEDGVLFYGMWKGYMQQPEMVEFLDFMKNKGVQIHVLHTSGHADAETIHNLVDKVNPQYIIPVHTENAKWFEKYKCGVNIVCENILCI